MVLASLLALAVEDRFVWGVTEAGLADEDTEVGEVRVAGFTAVMGWPTCVPADAITVHVNVDTPATVASQINAIHNGARLLTTPV